MSKEQREGNIVVPTYSSYMMGTGRGPTALYIRHAQRACICFCGFRISFKNAG